jgi:3'(2'), 5'-bisphosphate nucleotidase
MHAAYPIDCSTLMQPQHPLVGALRAGGGALMRYWRNAPQQQRKADGSWVSEADHAANDAVVAQLTAAYPHLPIVSEEGPQTLAPDQRSYWLIDPLDGTRGFLHGEADFAVSIALIHNRQAVVGGLYAPARDWLMVGAVGAGAWFWQPNTTGMVATGTPVQMSPMEVAAAAQGWRLVVATRGKTPKIDAYFAAVPIIARVPCPSAVKFVRLARGEGDMYPRFGETSQWDMAAGCAIIHAAGGEMVALNGEALAYGPHPVHGWQHPAFIAARIGGYAALQQMRHANGVCTNALNEGAPNA